MLMRIFSVAFHFVNTMIHDEDDVEDVDDFSSWTGLQVTESGALAGLDYKSPE